MGSSSRFPCWMRRPAGNREWRAGRSKEVLGVTAAVGCRDLVSADVELKCPVGSR